ncbi:MAG: hypothetical protein FJ087_21985 [Deltaproteobacteria bacterium]|nr:hypothetical protein [Deltaproteobacteria bacterium]
MGCCNKTFDGKPVGRLRYFAGIAFYACLLGGLLALLAAASLFSVRARRVLPFCREYARDRLASVWRRENIRVGAAPACTPPSSGGGA